MPYPGSKNKRNNGDVQPEPIRRETASAYHIIVLEISFIFHVQQFSSPFILTLHEIKAPHRVYSVLFFPDISSVHSMYILSAPSHL